MCRTTPPIRRHRNLPAMFTARPVPYGWKRLRWSLPSRFTCMCPSAAPSAITAAAIRRPPGAMCRSIPMRLCSGRRSRSSCAISETGRRLVHVHWGGGTPSILPLQCARQSCRMQPHGLVKYVFEVSGMRLTLFRDFAVRALMRLAGNVIVEGLDPLCCRMTAGPLVVSGQILPEVGHLQKLFAEVPGCSIGQGAALRGPQKTGMDGRNDRLLYCRAFGRQRASLRLSARVCSVSHTQPVRGTSLSRARPSQISIRVRTIMRWSSLNSLDRRDRHFSAHSRHSAAVFIVPPTSAAPAQAQNVAAP
jgi:hypothetical protein